MMCWLYVFGLFLLTVQQMLLAFAEWMHIEKIWTSLTMGDIDSFRGHRGHGCILEAFGMSEPSLTKQKRLIFIMWHYHVVMMTFRAKSLSGQFLWNPKQQQLDI